MCTTKNISFWKVDFFCWLQTAAAATAVGVKQYEHIAQIFIMMCLFAQQKNGVYINIYV